MVRLSWRPPCRGGRKRRVGVSNYYKSWHGVDVGGPTWRRSHLFLSSFLSPSFQYKPTASLGMVLTYHPTVSIPFLPSAAALAAYYHINYAFLMP